MNIPLSICFSPIFHRFSARMHANVDKRASFVNKGCKSGGPHEPSCSWLSNNQFTHSGKKGSFPEFGEGTIATQAVSYDETERSTLLNNFIILCLVPSKLCLNTEQHYDFIDIFDSKITDSGDELTKTAVFTSAVPIALGMLEAACGNRSFPNFYIFL